MTALCYYCGCTLGHYRVHKGEPMPSNTATRDHLQPRIRGGKGPGNKVDCCLKCNQDKGSLTLDEYIVVLQYRRNRAVFREAMAMVNR